MVQRGESPLFAFLLLSMNIVGFLSAAVLLTLMPGPDILFVITQSVTRGKRAGIIFAGGLCTGLIVHTLAVSLGLSFLLYSSSLAFFILKCFGAAYLIYLGVKAFIGRNQNMFIQPGMKGAESRLYRKGILMNVLNPKVLLFFIAFFPQFVDQNTGNVMGKFLLLGGLFMLQAMIIFSCVALLAERLSRRVMQNKRFSFFMHIVEAVIYLGVGVSLFFVE